MHGSSDASQLLPFGKQKSSCFLKVCSLPFALSPSASHSVLSDILPWTIPEAPVNKRPRIKAAGPALKAEATILDQFIVGKRSAESDEDGGDDVVMNEDGTMYAAGTAEDDES